MRFIFMVERAGASGGWCCMKYAEVAVDAPLGVNRTLTYSIPPRMEVLPGQLVWVPSRSSSCPRDGL